MRASLIIALCVLLAACSESAADGAVADGSVEVAAPVADATDDVDHGDHTDVLPDVHDEDADEADVASAEVDGEGDVACTCDGLECGTNPCGEACGTCPAAAPFCHDHVCFVDCQPGCGDAVCGDDACGGSCGACPEGGSCEAGACVGCPCDGAVCGDNACGESCGACPDGAPHCVAGACYVTPPPCPIAHIAVAEGDTVLPGTLLHLSAAQSTSPNSTVAAWEWAVVAPDGSASVFLPSAAVEAPQFEAAVVGVYTFTLRVYDAEGIASCGVATHPVEVLPPSAIHVELVWTTPGDPDETDTGFIGSGSAGTDLDLHFLHPLAFDATYTEGWFHKRYDTYWANPIPSPGWGSMGAGGTPSLDRDDTDGAGPEIITLGQPEQGRSYTVGVHYWDDWNYGASYATVRVYIYGELVFEWSLVPLHNLIAGTGDMWECCTITWPGGTVTKIEGGAPGSNIPFIREGYAEPAPFPF